MAATTTIEAVSNRLNTRTLGDLADNVHASHDGVAYPELCDHPACQAVTGYTEHQAIIRGTNIHQR